ncbi:MAG: alpha/beta hydrolase [Firmicutes bacterium]|nr:alpha/beta hydrolase [Bacillota bacterium]
MKLKKIGVVLCSIIVLLIAGSYWYIQDYYQVEESVSLENTMEESAEKIVYGNADSTVGLIFYPGGKVEFSSYAPLMERLSENNILCVVVHMPANLAILDTHAADEIMEQYPNIKNWYVGGHSLGGSAACMCLAAHSDQFKGLILLASYSTKNLSASNLPVLSIYGSEDGVLSRKSYDKNRKNLPKDTKEYVIQGGNHAGFGNYGDQKGDGQATISKDDQQKITVQQILQFIQEVSK